MSFATWITFFVATCIIAVSPGSGAVLSMSHGLSYGVRRTSATIFGLQGGLMLLFCIAGAGVGSLLLGADRYGLLIDVATAVIIACTLVALLPASRLDRLDARLGAVGS